MDVTKIGHELISTVVKCAPLLGSALGGPGGALVGSLIAKTFGGDENKPEDVLKQMLSDPEYKLKLMKLELHHKETLQSLAVKEEEIEYNDRNSAREYNSKVNDGVVHIIAIGYSGLFAIIFVLCSLKIVEVDSTIFMNIFSIAMIIVNYYFGSSHKKGKS